MKGKKAIAQILKKEGVEFVSLYPYHPTIDSLTEEGIRVIRTREERVAVNIADGYSRASFGDRYGVCAMQWGQGTENAFSGVAHAYADSVPMLVLPAGFRKHERQEPHFNAVLNCRGVTKWVERCNFPEQIPIKMRRAFNFLRNGRPGPVMLVTPRDVTEEEEIDDNFKYSSVSQSKPAPNSENVKEAVKLLLEAELPIIRAGSGVHYAQAWPELLELAELIQAPVFTTMNGKSAFPEDHELSLGAGGLSKPDTLVHFLEKTDLVFSIGSSLTKERYTTDVLPNTPIIQSTIDERDIGKDYDIELPIIGDAKLVMKELITEINKQGGSVQARDGLIEEIKSVKEEWLEKWKPKLTSDEVPINPYRVITEMNNVLDEEKTIVTHDSGMPRDQMLPFYRANTPGSYMGWGKSTTLGQSLGLMMGAKLAQPDKTAVAFMGDGAFGMVGMDFETAARESIPILVILLNNSCLAKYGDRFPKAAKRYNIDKVTGDYTKIAESLGAGYTEKVEKPDEIAGAIKRAQESLSTGKPSLLEIITAEEKEACY